jgi:hypothetical protein
MVSNVKSVAFKSVLKLGELVGVKVFSLMLNLSDVGSLNLPASPRRRSKF